MDFLALREPFSAVSHAAGMALAVPGTVKAVRADDLLLDLPLQPDRSVPLSAVLMVDDRVILSVSADAVGERSKPAPPGP